MRENPPAAGDAWTVTYFDNNGGNMQARIVRFEFKFDDAGDPATSWNIGRIESDYTRFLVRDGAPMLHFDSRFWALTDPGEIDPWMLLW